MTPDGMALGDGRSVRPQGGDRKRDRHKLPVKEAIRKELGKKAGDTITVELLARLG